MLSYKRAFELAMSQRNAILEDIKALTESVLLDVFDCELMIADALSKSGDSTGGRSGDVSRPTERAALRNAGAEAQYDENGEITRDAEPDPLVWTERERDVVGEAIVEFQGALAEAAGHLKQAKRKIPVIVDAGARLRGRTASVDDCRACGRPVLGTRDDRIKAGYCHACYEAWRRTGFEDRFTFERDRPHHTKSSKRAGHAKVAGP